MTDEEFKVYLSKKIDEYFSIVHDTESNEEIKLQLKNSIVNINK